jgi:AmmeMemoRadiSam system protein A
MATSTPSLTRAQDESGGPGDPAVPDLPSEVQRALLEIARAALAAATDLASGWTLAARVRRGVGSDLRAAVFVTLHEFGALRGCMGTLDPDQPIAEAVAAGAMTAALDDPRFYPIGAEELPDLRLDVSVLGRPVELRDLDAFVPGEDGVIVERGPRHGLLLPEVAAAQGWDVARMLTAACRKAGLPGDAWREPGTRRWRFRTVRFGGPAVEPVPAR